VKRQRGESVVDVVAEAFGISGKPSAAADGPLLQASYVLAVQIPS